MQNQADIKIESKRIHRQLSYISGLILFICMIVACHTDTNEIERHEKVLDAKIKKARAMQPMMDRFQKERVLVEEQYQRVEKLLGNRPDMKLWVKSMSKSMDHCGLRAEYIKPLPAREKGYYGEIPVSIRLSGQYHQLGLFCDNLNKEYRLLPVSDLLITQSANSIQAQLNVKVIYGLNDLRTSSKDVFPHPTLSPKLISSLSKDKQEMIRQKEKIVRELQPIIDQCLKYEKDRDLLQKIVTFISELQNDQSGCLILLNELNHTIPGQVWLTRLQFAENRVNLKGYGLSLSTIDDFKTALDAAPVFNSVSMKTTSSESISGQEVYEFTLEFTFEPCSTDISYVSEGQRDFFVSLIEN